MSYHTRDLRPDNPKLETDECFLNCALTSSTRYNRVRDASDRAVRGLCDCFVVLKFILRFLCVCEIECCAFV